MNVCTNVNDNPFNSCWTPRNCGYTSAEHNFISFWRLSLNLFFFLLNPGEFYLLKPQSIQMKQSEKGRSVNFFETKRLTLFQHMACLCKSLLIKVEVFTTVAWKPCQLPCWLTEKIGGKCTSGQRHMSTNILLLTMQVCQSWCYNKTWEGFYSSLSMDHLVQVNSRFSCVHIATQSNYMQDM